MEHAINQNHPFASLVYHTNCHFSFIEFEQQSDAIYGQEGASLQKSNYIIRPEELQRKAFLKLHAVGNYFSSACDTQIQYSFWVRHLVLCSKATAIRLHIILPAELKTSKTNSESFRILASLRLLHNRTHTHTHINSHTNALTDCAHNHIRFVFFFFFFCVQSISTERIQQTQ